MSSRKKTSMEGDVGVWCVSVFSRDPQKMFALGSLSFGGVPSVHQHLAASSFIQYVVW